MRVKQLVEKDDNGRVLSYGAKVIEVGWAEEDIIRKGLKLYLDYNPRKAKDRPSYEDKRMAVNMIEALKTPQEVSMQNADGSGE